MQIPSKENGEQAQDRTTFSQIIHHTLLTQRYLELCVFGDLFSDWLWGQAEVIAIEEQTKSLDHHETSTTVNDLLWGSFEAFRCSL